MKIESSRSKNLSPQSGQPSSNLTLIGRLLALWYKTIGPLHHKDRDCHFVIALQFCTYGEPLWVLTHAGYLLHRVEKTCASYAEAESRLVDLLADGIRSWLTASRDCDDADLDHSPEAAAAMLAELESLVPAR